MLPGMSWLPENAENQSLSTFKSMLGGVEEDDDWFLNTSNQIQPHPELNFGTNLIDSSSSCSPSSASVFPHLDPSQVQFFLPQNPQRNLFETNFDSGFENPFMGFTDLASNSVPQFQLTQMVNLPEEANTNTNPQMEFGSSSFTGFGENLVFNRPKTLKPLDNFTASGSQPTLFQKRAALRKNLGNKTGENLAISVNSEGQNGKRKCDEIGEEMSFDGYDSEDFAIHGGNSSNGNSVVTNGGDGKGKKKGMPAKNLMAERRRRKKLNDRLYMLRSVVPKISKMDRASILGDAIEYLKELLQKINDLHNELEMNPSGSALTPTTTSFYPLTPTTPGLPSRIKEELCPSSLPSPNGQPARVEVRQREGRAVNIHMFCGRRPGLLLSTMRALDNLGLDIQQAVISCFNGFALDIFRAEQQCGEGQEVHPDQIKAVLLDSAGLLA